MKLTKRGELVLTADEWHVRKSALLDAADEVRASIRRAIDDVGGKDAMSESAVTALAHVWNAEKEIRQRAAEAQVQAEAPVARGPKKRLPEPKPTNNAILALLPDFKLKRPPGPKGTLGLSTRQIKRQLTVEMRTAEYPSELAALRAVVVRLHAERKERTPTPATVDKMAGSMQKRLIEERKRVRSSGPDSAK